QIVHGEAQRTIDEAMDREAMRRGVDVRKLGRVLLHEVHRGRRDDARILVERRVVSQVIEGVADAAARWLVVDMGLKTYRIPRYAPEGTFGRCKGLALRLPSIGGGETGSTAGQTNGSLFQELPTVRSIGFHK